MVEEFCKNLNINPELEKKLKDAITNGSDKLAYLWLTDEADIFRELNMQLKYEFLRAIHTNLITNCHFFRDKDISFVVRVVPLLKPMQIPPGEQLWLPGDYSSSSRVCCYTVFFILEGEVGKYVVRNVESVNKNRKKIKYKAEPLPFPKKEGVVVDIGGKLMMVGRYSANSYVGEDDILFQRDRATVAMATKKTSMMVLSKVDMETIIQEEFPHIYGQIKKLALDRAIKELETIQKIDEIGKKENEFYEAIDYARKNKRTEADIHKQTHLLTMYEQTLDSFPLEQMIGESADLEPSLPLKNMADDEMINLLTTLQDCKEELRQRNQAELLIKQNLEKKIKANLKKHEFGLDSKESSSMKSPELSTKIDLEKKKELYQQLKKLNEQLDQLQSTMAQSRSDNYRLEQRIDSLAEVVQAAEVSVTPRTS